MNIEQPCDKCLCSCWAVDKQMQKHIETIEIDEQGVRCPKGVHETEHNTIIMNMKIPQTKRNNTTIRWNITEETDWDAFNKKLEEKTSPMDYETLQKYIIETMEQTITRKTTET